MYVITNFRPEDMPGARKKPATAKNKTTQTAEMDEKPATSPTSRKTTKGSQKPSKAEA